jgi:hypothetical protein
VLRPQVCAVLDALAPPLRWSLADGNGGRVQVSALDVGEWCAASGDGWVARLRPLGDGPRTSTAHCALRTATYVAGCVYYTRGSLLIQPPFTKLITKKMSREGPPPTPPSS